MRYINLLLLTYLLTGDRFWQTLTFSVNLRWFSEVPIRYAYHQLVVRNGTRVVDT